MDKDVEKPIVDEVTEAAAESADERAAKRAAAETATEAAAERAAVGGKDASDAEEEATEQILEARAQFYRMLSGLYFRTITQDEIDAMAGKDFTELRAGKDESIMAEGYDDMFRYLRKRNTGTRQELAEDFTSCFLGTKSYDGKQAMPYESLFRDSSGLLMQGPRNEVYYTFKEARLALKDELDLPEDHLSFEFEFMAILCDRALDALRGGDAEAFEKLMRTQAKFFELHIASWFDDFYEFAMKIVKTRFYRGVLKVTKGFVESEPQTMSEAAMSEADAR